MMTDDLIVSDDDDCSDDESDLVLFPLKEDGGDVFFARGFIHRVCLLSTITNSNYDYGES